MSTVSRVEWTQGLYLRPEHFQQQERFLESQRRRQSRLLHRYGWGVAALEFESGTRQSVGVTRIAGIMPDGLVFDSALDDCLPAPLPLVGVEDVVLHLVLTRALPSDIAVGGANGASHEHRYSARDETVRDVSSTHAVAAPTPPDPAIGVTVPNFRLVAGDEPPDGHEFIALARVSSLDEDGTPRFDPTFVPTCITLEGSAVFDTHLRALHGGLENASRALETAMAPDPDPAGGESGQTRERVAERLSHPAMPIALLLARHEERLRQLIGSGAHPSALYGRLSSLAAELAALGVGGGLSGAPLDYDHVNPVAWLEPLSREISTSLETLAGHAPLLAGAPTRVTAEPEPDESEAEETTSRRRQGPVEVPL